MKCVDSKGKAINGEKVTFNINGVFYGREIRNGTARMNLKLAPGDYIITAEYKGCKVSNNIHIKPILKASDLNMKYLDGSQFKVTVLDGQGKPLPNATVTFNINGVFYDRVSKEDGVARMNMKLMAGKYIITSSYNGLNIANTVTIT